MNSFYLKTQISNLIPQTVNYFLLLKVPLLNKNKKYRIFFLFFSFSFFLSFTYAQSIWFEGFEGTTFPPAGWNIIDISGVKTWERYTTYPHSGTGSARHEWSVETQTTALVTPAITLPNYGNPELNFWSYFQLIGYKYSGVLVSTTVNNNIEAFTEIMNLDEYAGMLGTWYNINIQLNAYLGETIYIAFLYDNFDGHNWTIDDININHFEGFVDMQAISVTPKTGEYAFLATNETIKVKLKNNGGAIATGFDLKLIHNGNTINTETFTGSIPSLSEATYSFNTTLNLSTAGTHTIQVVVLMPGDQVPENDMAVSTLINLGCEIVTTFPHIEGFENNEESLPPCWTQEYVKYSQNWKIHSAASAQGVSGLEPKTAFEGIYKAVFYTTGSGFVTKLITPPLNLSAMTNPALRFHHIQQRYANDQDSLKVYYKTSTTEDWILLEKYTGEVVEWTARTISLPNPSNQYYIAFEGYGEWGRSVQIDALSVGDFFETDIEVKAITPAGVHVGLSEQQIVTTIIKNNGRDPVSDFDLSLYLNDAFVGKEFFTGTIPGLDEVIYTFTTHVDLSVSGYYSLKVIADLDGDEVPENNELTVVVKNLVCDALTFPYDEGFEEDIFPPYCWINIGSWDRQTYSAHSGIGRARHRWWDGPHDSWLISPKFSLPSEGDFMLEFWSHVYDKKFFTYSGVWVSTTNTNTSSFTEILDLYGDLIPDEIWKRIEISLNAYAGKDIYIAFRYKNTGGQSGHIWSIDDINVFNLNNHIDAEVMEIITPPSLGMNMTQTETVTARIKNNGGENISGFKLILECNDVVITTENYIGYITSLASVNYTFNAKVNLFAEGLHTIKVKVVLDGDMNPNNDIKTKMIENRVCPPVVNFPWYGEFQGNSAGEIDNCWLNIDADNDTKKWFSHEEKGIYYAISESYDFFYEFELTPDNWLISPPLTLNQACTLSYKVGSANSELNGAEKYSVLISKTGIDLAGFTGVRTETIYPSDFTELLTGDLFGYGVKTVKVPLTSYAGETIHIAFRHWDCTAQAKLILTDINVFNELSVKDINGSSKTLVAWIDHNKLR